MLEISRDMALAVAAWAGCWFAFVGLRLLLRRCLKAPLRDASDLMLSFWLGWALALAVLQLWQLAQPIGWGSRWLLLVLAAVGARAGASDARRLWRRARSHPRTRPASFACATLALALLLANKALSSPDLFDTGLYHLQSVRWVEAFPIVPGLANLHRRFGFNSSYFLYVALMDVDVWNHEAYRLANREQRVAGMQPVRRR